MEWFSLSELLDLPALPNTVQGLAYKAKTEHWKCQPRQSKGGGKEYHISSLPPVTQAALLRRQDKVKVGDQVLEVAKKQELKYCRDTLWHRWNTAGEKAQQKAKAQLQAVEATMTMISSGIPAMQAYDAVVEEFGITKMTLRRCVAKVRPFERSDWVCALLSHHKDGAKQRRKKQFAEISPEAWTYIKTDYLRPEAPSLTICYQRLNKAAKEHGWTVPSLASITRRMKDEVDIMQKTLLRKGEHALAMMFPPQVRTVTEMHALEHLNGDGYQHNVFVRWHNGEIVRPKTWFWQDVYSRKIVGWRCDLSENKDSIRLSLMDVFAKYGIPKDITIDNTRAAANKELSGGKPNRYRFKVKEDEAHGILTTILGADHIHWTSILLGKGHGQAKPIERAFGVGGLDELIDRHPNCAGAYTGANPMAKPDNYASTAIDIDDFLKVIEQGMEMYNEKPNRQTEICQGVMSFDDAFNQSYATSVIRKATAPQLHMMMLCTEAVRVSAYGTISLNAGSTIRSEKNRYESPEFKLHHYIGKKVLVRFDPQNLHGSVEVYTLENVWICTAECTDKKGFNDRSAARETHKHRTQFVKATKIAAKAQQLMDVSELGKMLPDVGDDFVPDTKVVEPYRPTAIAIGNTAPKLEPQTDIDIEEEEELEANYAEYIQILQQQKRNRL